MQQEQFDFQINTKIDYNYYDVGRRRITTHCDVISQNDSSKISFPDYRCIWTNQARIENIDDETHIFKIGPNTLYITYLFNKEENKLVNCFYRINRNGVCKVKFDFTKDGCYFEFCDYLNVDYSSNYGLEIVLDCDNLPIACIFRNEQLNFNCFKIELNQNNTITGTKKSQRKFEFKINVNSPFVIEIGYAGKTSIIKNPEIIKRDDYEASYFKVNAAMLPYAFVNLLQYSDIENISDKYLYRYINNHLSKYIDVSHN